MSTKKKEELPVTNSNINNNTNNINVNVHVKKPRAQRKSSSKKQAKPNWVLKAIIITLITVGISIIGKYLLDNLNGGSGQAPVFEQKSPGFNRNN